MLWRYYYRSRLTKARADRELAALEEQAEHLRWKEAEGPRWRRNPDGTWSRWSYLGNAWEPGTPPGFAEDVARTDPSITEWVVGTDGVWRNAEETETDERAGTEPTPDHPDAPAADAAPSAAESERSAATEQDVWRETPPPPPTWQQDYVPTKGFTWVDEVRPQTPPPTPQGKQKGGRWKRAPNR